MSLTQNSKLKTQNCLTDWHCHLLPGIDDGPATMAEAVRMAEALCRAGYTTVHCTPHLIRGFYEADNDTARMTLVALQAELDRRRIGLRLLPGREYYLDEFLLDILKDPMPLGETSFLLIEIPSHAPVEFVKETCYRVTGSGYTPMVAHPERCAHFAPPETATTGWLSRFNVFNSLGPQFGSKPKAQHEEPAESLLGYLKEIGCAFQGNLGSFAGIYGERVRQAAERLRGAGVYTHYGSDLHSAANMDILARIEPAGGNAHI